MGLNFNNFVNDKLNEVDKWTLFGNRVVHFIHLNSNSFLLKIEQVCHLPKTVSSKTVAYSDSSNMHLDTECIFIEIYLHKLKSSIVGILYRPPE